MPQRSELVVMPNSREGRRIRFLRCLGNGALALFLGGLAAIMFAPLLSLNASQYQMMGGTVGLLMLSCGMIYIFSIVARDVLIRQRKPWQFSLATLLIAMTIVACVLGLAAVWMTY
jgi:hypothetical protein